MRSLLEVAGPNVILSPGSASPPTCSAALAAIAIATLVRLVIEGAAPSGFPFLTFSRSSCWSRSSWACGPAFLPRCSAAWPSWYWFLHPRQQFLADPQQRDRLGLLRLHHRHRDRAWCTGCSDPIACWWSSAKPMPGSPQTRELLFRELQHRVSNNLQMVAALLTVQRAPDCRRRAPGLPWTKRRVGSRRSAGSVASSTIRQEATRPSASFLDQLARDVIEFEHHHEDPPRGDLRPVMHGSARSRHSAGPDRRRKHRQRDRAWLRPGTG